MNKTKHSFFKGVYFYLETYYGGRKNLVKESNADELTSFKNKQGERIVSDETLEDLIRAKQFAFSSNKNKKQQYRCKIAMTLGSLAEESFKIEAVTTISCII